MGNKKITFNVFDIFKCYFFFFLKKDPLKISLTFGWKQILCAIIHVSLLSSFLLSFFAPSSHQLLPRLLYTFHCPCTTQLISCSLILCVFVLLLWPFFAVSLSAPYPLHLLLSQITLNVSQGRVQSPSPQPRYKSYAYTQAAYVKSPEQKRRRFTDQVRVSQS